jgi:predicted glutamine amidotransferase
LLACVSQTDCTVGATLASNLDDFTAMSREHKDGWGLAWHSGTGIAGVREPRTAADDPSYRARLDDTVTDAAMVHLRLATPGLPVTDANTHPFLRNGMAFMHNGFVGPIAALDALVAAGPAPVGDTDSERYFLAVLALMDTGVGAADALHATAHRMLTLAHTSGANAMLLTDDALHVVCAYRPGTEPPGRPADYFELRYRADETSIVIASTGVQQDGWTVLPNGHVLTVHRKALELSLLA